MGRGRRRVRNGFGGVRSRNRRGTGRTRTAYSPQSRRVAEKTQENTGLDEWGRRIVILKADAEEAEERGERKGILRQKAVFSPDRLRTRRRRGAQPYCGQCMPSPGAGNTKLRTLVSRPRRRGAEKPKKTQACMKRRDHRHPQRWTQRKQRARSVRAWGKPPLPRSVTHPRGGGGGAAARRAGRCIGGSRIARPRA